MRYAVRAQHESSRYLRALRIRAIASRRLASGLPLSPSVGQSQPPSSCSFQAYTITVCAGQLSGRASAHAIARAAVRRKK